MLQPVMVRSFDITAVQISLTSLNVNDLQVKLIESSIITAIDFFPDAVTTISRTGSIRFWTRPAEKSRTITHGARTEDLASKMKGIKVANGSKKERDAVSVQG